MLTRQRRPEPLGGEELIRQAEQWAEYAHQGQQDKNGEDYISHPRRVARRLSLEGNPPEVVAAGLLHDVLEDSSVTVEQLHQAGISPTTVRIVEAMTKTVDMEYTDYLTALTSFPPAAAVKRADIADNTDPQRLARLDPTVRQHLEQKYAHALRILDGGDTAFSGS